MSLVICCTITKHQKHLISFYRQILCSRLLSLLQLFSSSFAIFEAKYVLDSRMSSELNMKSNRRLCSKSLINLMHIFIKCLVSLLFTTSLQPLHRSIKINDKRMRRAIRQWSFFKKRTRKERTTEIEITQTSRDRIRDCERKASIVAQAHASMKSSEHEKKRNIFTYLFWLSKESRASSVDNIECRLYLCLSSRLNVESVFVWQQQTSFTFFDEMSDLNMFIW